MLKCNKSEKVKFEIPKNIYNFKTFEFFQGMVKKERKRKEMKKKKKQTNSTKEKKF